jgi:outer membrane protein OmpA-like peptidoglycan-associated protein
MEENARRLISEALAGGIKPEARQKLFHQAREADPGYVTAPCEAGARLAERSRHAQAAAGFQMCFENDPLQIYARFRYANSLLLWRGADGYVEARTALRFFLEKAPEDPIASRDPASRRTAEQLVLDLEELLREENTYPNLARYSAAEIERILLRKQRRGASRYEGPRVPLRLGFRPRDTSLTAASREQLQEVARALRFGSLADSKILIEGHTDSVEAQTRKARAEVARRRAESVKNFLVRSCAIPAARLTVAGLGDDYPLEPNDTNAGRDANRRVELVNLATRDLVRGDSRNR